MEYRRAIDILPDHLLKEIQEFAQGCLIYIPNKSGTRRNWGERTDGKRSIARRNSDMRRDYRAGFSVRDIASKYYLAESTVKNIVYKK